MNKSINTTYLLSLAILHTAAPGVLDVVFGADGDFEGAPHWCPVLWVHGVGWADYHNWYSTGLINVWYGTYNHHRMEDCYLDLRIPSVAARLAGLCLRVVEGDRIIFDGSPPIYAGEFLRAAMCSPSAGGFDSALAAELAALTLALAPRIRDLDNKETR